MDPNKFGIYLNAKDGKAVRITSPYWRPEEPDWVLVTSDTNATLLRVREIAEEKKLVSESSGVVWGSLPLLD